MCLVSVLFVYYVDVVFVNSDYKLCRSCYTVLVSNRLSSINLVSCKAYRTSVCIVSNCYCVSNLIIC